MGKAKKKRNILGVNKGDKWALIMAGSSCAFGFCTIMDAIRNNDHSWFAFPFGIASLLIGLSIIWIVRERVIKEDKEEDIKAPYREEFSKRMRIVKREE